MDFAISLRSCFSLTLPSLKNLIFFSKFESFSISSSYSSVVSYSTVYLRFYCLVRVVLNVLLFALGPPNVFLKVCCFDSDKPSLLTDISLPDSFSDMESSEFDKDSVSDYC